MADTVLIIDYSAIYRMNRSDMSAHLRLIGLLLASIIFTAYVMLNTARGWTHTQVHIL